MWTIFIVSVYLHSAGMATVGHYSTLTECESMVKQMSPYNLLDVGENRAKVLLIPRCFYEGNK